MAEEKKYELTNENIEVNGHILHRIRALRDFNNIKVGDLGGFIESGDYLSHDGGDNLSHDGGCWIYDNAKVHGHAVVHGNAEEEAEDEATTEEDAKEDEAGEEVNGVRADRMPD